MTQRNPWRVFIIHGFDASPEEHWFPWLCLPWKRAKRSFHHH